MSVQRPQEDQVEVIVEARVQLETLLHQMELPIAVVAVAVAD
jgi:hypothetical protein